MGFLFPLITAISFQTITSDPQSATLIVCWTIILGLGRKGGYRLVNGICTHISAENCLSASHRLSLSGG
jgi:hypothetical protein